MLQAQLNPALNDLVCCCHVLITGSEALPIHISPGWSVSLLHQQLYPLLIRSLLHVCLLTHRLADSPPAQLVRLVYLLQQLGCAPSDLWASKLADGLVTGLMYYIDSVPAPVVTAQLGTNASRSTIRRGGSSSSSSSSSSNNRNLGSKNGLLPFGREGSAPAPADLVAALAALESCGVPSNAALDATAAAYLRLSGNSGDADY
jgi:hypothetical protein